MSGHHLALARWHVGSHNLTAEHIPGKSLMPSKLIVIYDWRSGDLLATVCGSTPKQVCYALPLQDEMRYPHGIFLLKSE